MMPYDLVKHTLGRRKTCSRVLLIVMVCSFLLFATSQFLLFHIFSVRAQPSSLLVFAEASSFARLDPIDPSGWFYQAVLYNPTDSDIVVTGLRWWYNASEKIIDGSRDAKCYDSRYFSFLPDTYNPNDRTICWEYVDGDISLTATVKTIIVTWIEVPTYSKNDDRILATYYVEAFVDGQWLSSPLYFSHIGNDNAVSTVFRADFDLATDPSGENHTHQNPEWLFSEDRSVVAGLSTRVRLIPVASSRFSLGINYATVNVTLPSGWSYVPDSAYNPYGETITPYYVDGKDGLEWYLDSNVLRYSMNQSMAQNYIEFNVTAPHVPSIHSFTVTSIITSLNVRTTKENQFIYAVVKTTPNATFTYSPKIPLTGENVTLNATASYDLDGQIVDYFWDYGDGETGTGNITTHAYADNGTYTVMLTITDNDGFNDTALDTITVQNRSPFAQFTESAEIVDTDMVIYFNASYSYDLDGSIVSYFWDFGDGTNATGKVVSHAYLDNGNYTVTLVVTDDNGATDSVNATKTVLNRFPVALYTESATTVYTGQTIYFNASDSYDPDGYIVNYFWHFGDGTNNTGVTVSHIYTEDGSYTLNLTVTDDDGSSAVATHVLTILNRAPVASFIIFPQQPVADDSITFDATDSYDPDGTIVNYIWNFGDGNTTATNSGVITHIYHEYGDFNVTLTIVDNDSYNNTTSQIINVPVHDIAILNTTVSQTEVHVGQVVNITVTVKNEGTTTESFNVTVFRNETIIETQLVSNLAPDAEKTLIFYWDTSDITDTANFSIKAKADVVSGETHVTDNTHTGGIIKVSKPHLSPFSLSWKWILLVVIPCIALFVTGILWKKRHANQKFQNYGFFDKITDGGIPDSFSVLITGEPSSGKSMLCQQLTHMFLTGGKSCVYTTYDCFPDEVRENMKKFHWDTSKYEDEGKFVFIDCFSSIAKVTSKEKYSVSQPFSLSDLGIMMTKATSEEGEAPRVLLDSLAPLVTHVDPSKVVEFLQNRSARIKGIKGTFIFVAGRETIEPKLISRLEGAVDCIIELDVSTSQGKTIRKLRIKKMRGRKAFDKWIEFEIDPAEGITFLA
jgi:KaiC/GvpD/RAD55 family RecA-like ATPase/PKD repeat protein